jgi:hypothetical protein
MSNRPVAGTQYCDLIGTIAVDGHGAPHLAPLLERHPSGKSYFPVGISFYASDPSKTDRGFVSIFAVDREVVGVNADQIKSFVKKHGKLPVFKLDVEATVEELVALVHRINVVLFSRYVADEDVEVHELPDE